MRKLCRFELRTLALEVQVSGWGGWIRTNTVCINSAASYQLDHAPIPMHGSLDFIVSPVALQQIRLGRETRPVTLYLAFNSFAVLII